MKIPLITIMTFLIFTSAAFCQDATVSIAVKEGYSFFKDNDKSPYEGNTVMDNEWTKGGGYIRITDESAIYRLDADIISTGNTFSKEVSIAYETANFRIVPVIFSAGGYFFRGNRRIGFLENLYILGGMGYSFNQIDTEQYTASPFTAEIRDSYCLSVTLGNDFNVNENVYLFGEMRYIYNKADIYINSVKSHEEDLSNLGVYGGIALRF